MQEAHHPEFDLTHASAERLMEAMDSELEKAKTPEVKFLAAKNKLQSDLMRTEVAKTTDVTEEEWYLDYAGFLSLVLDNDLNGPDGKEFREKMLSGTLTDEEKTGIMSRVHELYTESLN
jgi:hypothetical protein